MGRLFAAARYWWPVLLPLLIYRYRSRIGRWPSLHTPRTFNEKILHRLLFDRRTFFTTFAGKWESRAYVNRVGGAALLTELVGAVTTASEWQSLALPEKFILKGNHMSGLVHIHDGTGPLDVGALGRLVEEWCGRSGRVEWAYHGCRRAVLVEKLIQVNGQVPKDYKFFCYSGRCHYIQVDGDRFAGHVRDYFDREWNWLDLRVSYPNASPRPARPDRLTDMVRTAEQLSGDADFVRVDLYEVAGQNQIWRVDVVSGGWAGTVPSRTLGRGVW